MAGADITVLHPFAMATLFCMTVRTSLGHYAANLARLLGAFAAAAAAAAAAAVALG